MHAIKPLHALTRAEVRALAVAAADRGEPVATANPFEPGTHSFDWFQAEYRHRHDELSPA